MEMDYLKHIESVDRTELYNLMSLYGDDVLRYAYAITKNGELAKDIAQEVFLKVHLRSDSYRGQSSIRTWLFSIARNLAINEMRSAYFRRMVPFGEVRTTRTEISAEAAYIGSRAAAELRAIMMRLPVKLREVLALDLEHEMTVREMAGVLAIPEGTVKSRLNRARAKVEKEWRRLEHE